jgi:hypothetical protein
MSISRESEVGVVPENLTVPYKRLFCPLSRQAARDLGGG